jgi:hypothetical protein
MAIIVLTQAAGKYDIHIEIFISECAASALAIRDVNGAV